LIIRDKELHKGRVDIKISNYQSAT